MPSPNQPSPAAGKSIAQKSAKLLNALLFDQNTAGNQRKDLPRESVAGEVVVVRMHAAEGEADRFRVFIRDLSSGGCGLWSRIRIEPGSSIVVIFQGPDGQPVQRTARVRHCRGQEGTGYAVGVQFDVEDRAAKRKSA